jgi:hypothetical protein
MVGQIVKTQIKHRQGLAGGLIRVAELKDRVPFAASELAGVRLADSLGCRVQFDLNRDGEAVRVRPMRGVVAQQ